MNFIKNIFQIMSDDFSAKIRWRMRHDKNPLFVTLMDKYKVKEYAKTKGVKTAKLLYVTENPETIPFEKLPDNFFIKANNGCGWNILCSNKNLYLFGNGLELVSNNGLFEKNSYYVNNELSRSKSIQLCKKWLRSYYSKKEWGYQNILPKIIIEELLVGKNNTALNDYRMYTFHGKVKAINVGSALYRKNGENVFFNPEWKEIKLTRYKESLPSPLPQKPTNLSEMINISERLGEEIDFARIDLYDTLQGIILGEITIYPEAGNYKSPTTCPFFNKWLGDQWELGEQWKPKTISIYKDLCWGIYYFSRSCTSKVIRKMFTSRPKREQEHEDTHNNYKNKK